MGFSLKKAVGGAIGGIAGATIAPIFNAISGGNNVSAPNLPSTPQLNEYGAVPDFTPQELAYLKQQQDLLDQYRASMNQQPNAYQQSSDQIAAVENKNYLDALNQASGTLTVGQAQQQKKDFEKLVAAAGARGIRILGDDPMTATSDSTAGNQILSDFNQRYQTLADQNRQAQLQMGYSQNAGRLGLAQQAQQSNLANILNAQTAYGNLMSPYQQQRMAQYGVQNANVDIRNQGLLNNYQSAYNQQMLNYQANAQNQANRMGFINSLIGLGGTIGGALIAGPVGAAAGGALGGAASGAYKSQVMPSPSMGMAPYNSYNKLSLY